MKPHKHCIHLLLFNGGVRHGGVRRTSQISECLESHFESRYFCLDLYKNKKHSFASLIRILLNIIPFFSLVLRSSLGFRQSINAIVLIIEIRSYLKRRNISPKSVVFACETCYPGPSLAISHYLQLCGYSTIVFPHNIECLVPGSSGRFRSNILSRSRLFYIEMNVMLNAEKVFTISNFDNAILQCLSVKAEVFPYYPSSIDLQNIYAVRSARENKRHNSRESNFLILGTVNNVPSYEGMVNLLSLIANSVDFNNFNFIVAGYGTDKLQDFCKSNISVLGAVSSSRLIDLLVNCEAALVSQSQTTGMLTRLIELNLSKVPVIMASPYIQAVHLEKYSIFSAPDESTLVNRLSQCNVCHSDFSYFDDTSLLL